MAKIARLYPFDTVTGAQINAILDIIDGGSYTLANTPATSGGGSTFVGGSPNNGGQGSGTGSGANVYPQAPTGLVGSGMIDNIAQVNNGSITLSWNANPGSDFVTYYQLTYRKGADSTPYYNASALTNIKISGLFPGTTYTFAVRAFNAYGYSSPWSTECVVALSPDVVPPPVPSGLTALSGTKNVYLQWTPVTGDQAADLQRYDVAYSTDGGFNFSVVPGSVGATYAFPYTAGLISLNSGGNSTTSLRFMVRSVDWSGNTSLWSNPGSGGTNGQPPYSGAGGVAVTVGALAWDEITVGNVRSVGTIAANGGFTTRVGGTGPGFLINQTAIYGYDNTATDWGAGAGVTFRVLSASGDIFIKGTINSSTVNSSTIIGSTIETNSNPLVNGGTLMNNAGVLVVADGSSTQPQGTVVWYAQNNGQFKSAQYYPVYTGYTPVDGSNPATARFQVTSDISKIISVKVSFYCDTFKVGNQTASAGGSSHNHSVTIGNHTHSTPDHSHRLLAFSSGSGSGFAPFGYLGKKSDGTTDIAIDLGTGSFDDIYTYVAAGGSTSGSGGATTPTSSGESSHTHNLNAPSAIYNTGGASGVHVKLYNQAGTLLADHGPYAGGAGVFTTDVDITADTTWTAQWYQVQFTSSGLGGIEGQINIKAIVQAI